MGQTLTYKILGKHHIEGNLTTGEQIGIRIDQTLTQDATGTTAFLLYETIGAAKVKTDLSVSYIDHNMAGFGPENHNDHLYLQTIAAKCGVYHSRAGNGICHQVHLERFGKPAATLLGSDSHTPTGGGIGTIDFNDTLDGAFDLDLTAGGGDVVFGGTVGGVTDLADVTLVSAADVTVNAFDAATLTQSAGTGTTTFDGAVNTTGAGGIALTGNAFTVNDTIDTANGGTVTVTNAGLLTFAAGGDLDTVREGITGTFFHQKTPEALIQAVKEFDETSYDSAVIRRHAERFDKRVFQERLSAFVEERYAEHRKRGMSQ